MAVMAQFAPGSDATRKLADLDAQTTPRTYDF
jgi:hypothetical protein